MNHHDIDREFSTAIDGKSGLESSEVGLRSNDFGT